MMYRNKLKTSYGQMAYTEQCADVKTCYHKPVISKEENISPVSWLPAVSNPCTHQEPAVAADNRRVNLLQMAGNQPLREVFSTSLLCYNHDNIPASMVGLHGNR